VEIPGVLKVEFSDQHSEEQAKAKAKEAVKEISTSQQTAIKWDKVATLFWLGNDLMWIQDQLYRSSSPERISEGIDNTALYMHDLEFAHNSLPIKELDIAKQILRGVIGHLPSDNRPLFLEGHYRSVEQYVQTVKWYIDALATNQQPDFEKLRVM
jgi:hypothetical protein